MTAKLHYELAPITEAIIDLRVSTCESLELHQLQSLPSEVSLNYPDVKNMVEAREEMRIEVGKSASASAQQKTTGFRFTSNDKKHVCQQRLNGFTLSRLAPYESWQPFRDTALQMWSGYREIAQPDTITRLAVRYVNRIDIPGQSIDLKDYFRTSPEVSPELPQELSGFFMQLRILQEDIQSEILINQTIVPPLEEEVVSVVLDLDIFRHENVPQEEEEIWEFFEVLHDQKNRAFESCITDKTRELFSL